MAGLAEIGGGGVPATGSTVVLAGDAVGNSAANTVVKIRHNAVDAAVLGLGDAGKFLRWDGAKWAAAALAAPVVQVYTCPSGAAVRDAVYHSGDLAVDLADASNPAKLPVVGFIVTKPTATTCTVQHIAELGGFTGPLVPGATYYADPAVPGGITATKPAFPDSEQAVGVAASVDILDILLGAVNPDCGSWITSSAGISVLGSTYTVSVDNGAYEDTGLSVTLPSAGTYIIWYTARTNVAAAGAAGAFIEVQLYNSTDGSALANSEEIGAYASTVTASYYGVPHLTTTASVAASKVIKLYVKSVAPGTTTVRTVNSDTNGRTNLGYMKISS